MSKYSDEELEPYADWFYGSKSYPEEYDRAFLHHIHNNPHHWQYWVLPPGFNPDGNVDNGCIEMPEEYILEMIADWMGANMAYQSTWDMSHWLYHNFHKIQMHSKSMEFLKNKLIELGYGDVIEKCEKKDVFVKVYDIERILEEIQDAVFFGLKIESHHIHAFTKYVIDVISNGDVFPMTDLMVNTIDLLDSFWRNGKKDAVEPEKVFSYGRVLTLSKIIILWNKKNGSEE